MRKPLQFWAAQSGAGIVAVAVFDIGWAVTLSTCTSAATCTGASDAVPAPHAVSPKETLRPTTIRLIVGFICKLNGKVTIRALCLIFFHSAT
jgi:hypothetical protein